MKDVLIGIMVIILCSAPLWLTFVILRLVRSPRKLQVVFSERQSGLIFAMSRREDVVPGVLLSRCVRYYEALQREVLAGGVVVVRRSDGSEAVVPGITE